MVPGPGRPPRRGRRGARPGACGRPPAAEHHGPVLRAAVGLVVGVILSVFAYLLVRGQYIQEGPVVLLVSEERGWGVHRGDILIAGGWLIGMIAIATLVWDRWPPRDRDGR
jgi:hypothetical protein